MKRTACLIALCLGLLAAYALASQAEAPAPAAKRLITLEDMAKFKVVGDPQRSPDGAWVAFTVSTTDVEKDKRSTDIWMVSWDGNRLLRMTSGPDGASAPRWSPDGRYLSFLAARGTEEEKKLGPQVWLLDRTGGEAERLTEIKGGVGSYAWSPDSKRLVLTSEDVNPADEPEKMEGWKRKTPPPIVIDRYHFKQDREGYLQRFYTHLMLFDVESRKAEALTSGPYDDENPVWSPDGTRIAFVSNHSPDPDRTEDTNVYLIEARTGAVPKAITTFPGPDGQPAWSPDGKLIAYLQGDEPRFSAYQLNRVAVVPAEGGRPALLTGNFDRSAEGRLLWTKDGRSILFTFDDDRSSYIGRVPSAGGNVEKLTPAKRTVYGASIGDDGALTLLSGSATETPEVYALENGTLRKLSHQNDALLAGLQLAGAEEFNSKSKDGTVVGGLIAKPAGYAAGKRYPTLLWIHGGPNGQDDYSFDFDREFFAANGYVVLQVNYRGSSGRGSAFQKAIYADWGNKEVVDLLGAVDGAVAAGIADPDRLGIGGWSYGGILTDYTIATTPRFKAAVSGAGSALQLTMYGVDQYIFQYEQEIGLPWKTRDRWIKISYPFFHADRIKTPTLFMGGEKDFNVPLVGGEQMYEALKSQGIETQLVIYPGQYHGLTVPSYLRDRLTRDLAWYDKFLKPKK
jgi:dipeptidyl aminopeptidase/acylaminoacyl peptidase